MSQPHRQIIRKFKRRKVYSSFKDNYTVPWKFRDTKIQFRGSFVWGVDLADMQLLSKCNKGIKYLLCGNDLFSKYAWVIPLKAKIEIGIVNAFQKIISEGRKPNKIWVDQGGEFYNNLFKSFSE